MRKKWTYSVNLFCVYSHNSLHQSYQKADCRHTDLHSQRTQPLGSAGHLAFFHSRFYYPAVHKSLWMANDTHIYLPWFSSHLSFYSLVNQFTRFLYINSFFTGEFNQTYFPTQYIVLDFPQNREGAYILLVTFKSSLYDLILFITAILNTVMKWFIVHTKYALLYYLHISIQLFNHCHTEPCWSLSSLVLLEIQLFCFPV